MRPVTVSPFRLDPATGRVYGADGRSFEVPIVFLSAVCHEIDSLRRQLSGTNEALQDFTKQLAAREHQPAIGMYPTRVADLHAQCVKLIDDFHIALKPSEIETAAVNLFRAIQGQQTVEVVPDAMRAGYDAQERGETADSNPHADASPDYACWRTGWYMAQNGEVRP